MCDKIIADFKTDFLISQIVSTKPGHFLNQTLRNFKISFKYVIKIIADFKN
jgi:hypothetical protein